jgi:hypothetical protein
VYNTLIRFEVYLFTSAAIKTLLSSVTEQPILVVRGGKIGKITE